MDRSVLITLILGGARSGKSAVAERLASTLAPPVTYLATAAVDVDDAGFVARIEAHRARRPSSWCTVETGGDLTAHLAAVEGTVVVDSLGTWVAAQDRLVVDHRALIAAVTGRRGDTVLVSDEVGLGVHPSTEVGGRFRDQLGLVNQAVAAVADRSLLVVAGLVVALERSPW